MRNDTRLVFNQFMAAIAELNGVPNATEKFAVSTSVQQTLGTKLQEKSEFLSKINVLTVTEQQGEKLGLGIGSPIASTKDTTNADRQAIDPTNLDGVGYIATQTNFDTLVKYSKLDAWAKFKDFQIRLRDAIIQRQALDRITIGFNGAARAATSDRGANPLLQDVNIGWLQKYRTHAAARVMHEGAVAGAVRVGGAAGHDYANLDALVFDAVNSLIDPWHQDDTGLVVICGRALLADKYFPILNQANQANTEAVAADVIVSQKRIGGIPAARVPYFPANALMVTRFDNLSIYEQEGSRRRNIIDNPKRDAIENYESANEAYVVEDFGLGCVVENIVTAW